MERLSFINCSMELQIYSFVGKSETSKVSCYTGCFTTWLQELKSGICFFKRAMNLNSFFGDFIVPQTKKENVQYWFNDIDSFYDSLLMCSRLLTLHNGQVMHIGDILSGRILEMVTLYTARCTHANPHQWLPVALKDDLEFDSCSLCMNCSSYSVETQSQFISLCDAEQSSLLSSPPSSPR